MTPALNSFITITIFMCWACEEALAGIKALPTQTKSMNLPEDLTPCVWWDTTVNKTSRQQAQVIKYLWLVWGTVGTALTTLNAFSSFISLCFSGGFEGTFSVFMNQLICHWRGLFSGKVDFEPEVLDLPCNRSIWLQGDAAERNEKWCSITILWGCGRRRKIWDNSSFSCDSSVFINCTNNWEKKKKQQKKKQPIIGGKDLE